MITFGVVILLFCVYQLGWTNVTAHAATDQASEQLRHSWSQQPSATASGSPGASPDASPGASSGAGSSVVDAFAFIHIPRLGSTYVKPVVAGTDASALKKGVGHYTGTVMPGQVGNFAAAGHRATNGEPFRHLDELRPGDFVVIEDASTWFTYEITPPPSGVGVSQHGRPYDVYPNQVDVLDPVPNKPGAQPTEKLITLTTCDPRWNSKYRMIYHGVLVSQQPKSQGKPNSLAAPARDGG